MLTSLNPTLPNSSLLSYPHSELQTWRLRWDPGCVTPAARGSRDEGSRNLGSAFPEHFYIVKLINFKFGLQTDPLLHIANGNHESLTLPDRLN